MKFETKGVKSDNGTQIGQFIQIGPNMCKIKGLTAVFSKAGDKFKVQANVETKPIGEDFEGWPDAETKVKALGQIGRIDLSIYTNGEDKWMQDFLSKIGTIADSLNVRPALDAIVVPEGSDIHDYLKLVEKVVCIEKYACYLIGGEEYEGKDKEGKPRVKISIKIPRYGYVAANEQELLAKMKDGKFPDKDTDWFYKKLEKMDEDTPEDSSSDEVFTEGKPDF